MSVGVALIYETRDAEAIEQVRGLLVGEDSQRAHRRRVAAMFGGG